MVAYLWHYSVARVVAFLGHCGGGTLWALWSSLNPKGHLWTCQPLMIWGKRKALELNGFGPIICTIVFIFTVTLVFNLWNLI